MRIPAFMAFGLFVLAAVGVEPAGVGVDAVAVSARSVSRPVAEVSVPVDKAVVPIEAVTVPVGPKRRLADAPSLEALVETVRDTRLKESERLAALGKIDDQDAIFYLFFKPGKDRCTAIRIAAVNRIAEVDVLKALGAKTPIPEIREAVNRRLEAIYPDNRDRTYADSAVVRAYVARMRARR